MILWGVQLVYPLLRGINSVILQKQYHTMDETRGPLEKCLRISPYLQNLGGIKNGIVGVIILI